MPGGQCVLILFRPHVTAGGRTPGAPPALAGLWAKVVLTSGRPGRALKAATNQSFNVGRRGVRAGRYSSEV